MPSITGITSPRFLNAKTLPLLAFALTFGTPKIVKILIAAKADVNARDTDGRSVLYYLNRSTFSAEERRDLEKLLRAAGLKTSP